MPDPQVPPNPQLSLEQQLAICSRVATLVKARLPIAGELTRGLHRSAARVRQPAAAVEAAVAGGQPLADTLAGDSSRHSRSLHACIEAGERSGSLDRILEDWSEMHLANGRHVQALRTALIYPSLLILVTLCSLGFVVWLLIPEYQATYQLFQYELPGWLKVLVRIREHMAAFMTLLIAALAVPLIFWFWRRRSHDSHNQPRNQVRRLRLQALASDLCSHLLEAQVTLKELAPLATRSMHASDPDIQLSFERLCQQRRVSPLASETSMLLVSLHVGLIDRQEAIEQLRAVAQQLRTSADMLANRSVRWLPMMVALIVGATTILTYVLLIYLPWVALLSRIVETGGVPGP